VTNSGRDLWAVVLAEGQGVRLRPLTRLVCGDDRPKQFASLVGSRSMRLPGSARGVPVVPRGLGAARDSFLVRDGIGDRRST